MTPLRTQSGLPRRASRLAPAIAALLACSSAALATPADTPASGLRLTRFVSGLDKPVALVAAPGDPRLFVVEQTGRIRVVENGQLRRAPFLDLTDRVGTNGNERGLLGLAFHPRFAENGFLYLNYTDLHGDNGSSASPPRPTGRVRRTRAAS